MVENTDRDKWSTWDVLHDAYFGEYRDVSGGGSSGSSVQGAREELGTGYPRTTVKIAAFGKDLYKVSCKVLASRSGLVGLWCDAEGWEVSGIVDWVRMVELWFDAGGGEVNGVVDQVCVVELWFDTEGQEVSGVVPVVELWFDAGGREVSGVEDKVVSLRRHGQLKLMSITGDGSTYENK